MSKLSWISKNGIAAIAALVVSGALALAGPGTASAQSKAQSDKSAAESPARAGETYNWSAELVAFDAPSNTVTVKATMVSNPEATDFSTLHAGDRAVLTWSGLTLAAGVRAVQRGNTSSFDRLTMPIEFVSAEPDGRYVTFKVPIPAKDAAAIAKLNPGAFVTATSPLRAKSAAEAVAAIRPYNAG
jgi:hypothetical protein